jgi:release factor glutamine methyltransferase
MERVVREKISGFSFTVRPTVFNPRDFVSSEIFAAYIITLDLSGKNILDMGSGSGVVSIFAASRGASCVACDINPVAVRCITENALQNKLSSQIKVYESDLFESLNSDVGSGFDIIFFNPPYYKGNPHNNFERAFKGGPNLEVIDRFLLDAKEHLAPLGKLCMIVSSDIDMDDFYSRLKNSGYTYKILHTNKKFFETFYIIDAVI